MGYAHAHTDKHTPLRLRWFSLRLETRVHSTTYIHTALHYARVWIIKNNREYNILYTVRLVDGPVVLCRCTCAVFLISKHSFRTRFGCLPPNPCARQQSWVYTSHYSTHYGVLLIIIIVICRWPVIIILRQNRNIDIIIIYACIQYR